MHPPAALPAILVVDDDRDIREMLQRVLEMDGFAPRLAASGKEAIELYRQQPRDIALVLLDVQMPMLDGPQTLDALRRLDPQVRCCFMSGDTGDYTAESLLGRGAGHIFQKPFRLEEFCLVLRRMVEC